MLVEHPKDLAPMSKAQVVTVTVIPGQKESLELDSQ